MKNRRCLLEHTLRILLPVVILMGIITGSCQVKRTQIKASNDVTYVKAKVIEVLEDYSGGKPYGGVQKVSAKITSGEFKGQICELENSNTYQRGAYCVTGTKVIAMVKNIVGTTSGVIISGGLAMIIGKLSNLSGYNMSDVESMIYIAYNLKLRVSYILYAGICKMYGKTENEARKMLRDVDRRRAINYAYYTDEVWGQAKNYTLCLNSSKLGFDKCEEIIIGLL